MFTNIAFVIHFVSTASTSEALVGTFMTIGDVNNIFAIRDNRIKFSS